MGIRVFASLIISFVACTAWAGNCAEFFWPAPITELKDFLDQSESGAYTVTMENESEILIVTNNFKPEKLIALEEVLNEQYFSYEILKFHGRTAYHINL